MAHHRRRAKLAGSDRAGPAWRDTAAPTGTALRINLKPEGEGELGAEYGIEPRALLKVVGFTVAGGRCELYSAYPVRMAAVLASLKAT